MPLSIFIMKAPLTSDDVSEEFLTRWIDGQVSEEEAERVGRSPEVAALLAREVDLARGVGGWRRELMPTALEPPGPEFFTRRVLEEIRGEVSLGVARGARRRWWKMAWVAPMASAAAVALLFLAASGGRLGGGEPRVARAYAPDPKVLAHAFYSEAAEATVIDLEGLEPVPDGREIRAYAVAEAGPAVPGRGQLFHAANGGRAVLALVGEGAEGPRWRALE